MRTHRILQLPALLLALAAGACRDLPTSANPLAPPETRTERTELRCSVSVGDRRLTCEPPGARGARRNIILGGQGLNVRLTSTKVTYLGGDNVLTADVAVQNLLDQPIGTDGSNSYGLRVFFVSGPTVTEGTGSVDVLTDSMGTFTAANQKYFVYPEVLQPRQVSQAQTWTFTGVDAGVVRFDFRLYVETQVPAETSILHFRPEHGAQLYYGTLYGVWAASAHDVFAVSDGAVLHYDGNYWRAMDVGGCGCAADLNAVWGSSGHDVFAVGQGGAVVHWTGTDWVEESDPDLGTENLYSVWVSRFGRVWAVGDGGQIVQYDGGDWTTAGSEALTTVALFGVWGANEENVWAVGDSGTVLHDTGGGWVRDTTLAGQLNAVWGTATDDVWAAGYDPDAGGGVLYHYDGSVWTEVTDPEIAATDLTSGWSASPTDVYVASGGDVLHYDGSEWTRSPVGSGAPLFGVTGADAANVFAVGAFATIAKEAQPEWKVMSISELDIYSIWGSSASDVWAVGGPLIYHRGAGGAWSFDFAPEFTALLGIWGSSATDIVAAGEYGTIIRYDGVSWNTVHVDSAISTLGSVWGSSAGDVWVGGTEGALLHWDGAAWSTSTLGVGGSIRSIWGSGAADVYAVTDAGEAFHWDGGAWTAMTIDTPFPIFGVWGSGPGDVYAAVLGGILHYDGNPSLQWTPVDTPADPGLPINAIWGSGPNDIFAASEFGQNLIHWDGTAWKQMVPYSANADIHLYTLWGTSSRNVYAAGDVGIILHGQR